MPPYSVPLVVVHSLCLKKIRVRVIQWSSMWSTPMWNSEETNRVSLSIQYPGPYNVLQEWKKIDVAKCCCCSLRYWLKCYFSYGVYSFMRRTVFIHIYLFILLLTVVILGSDSGGSALTEIMTYKLRSVFSPLKLLLTGKWLYSTWRFYQYFML